MCVCVCESVPSTAGRGGGSQSVGGGERNCCLAAVLSQAILKVDIPAACVVRLLCSDSCVRSLCTNE